MVDELEHKLELVVAVIGCNGVDDDLNDCHPCEQRGLEEWVVVKVRMNECLDYFVNCCEVEQSNHWLPE